MNCENSGTTLVGAKVSDQLVMIGSDTLVTARDVDKDGQQLNTFRQERIDKKKVVTYLVGKSELAQREEQLVNYRPLFLTLAKAGAIDSPRYSDIFTMINTIFPCHEERSVDTAIKNVLDAIYTKLNRIHHAMDSVKFVFSSEQQAKEGYTKKEAVLRAFRINGHIGSGNLIEITEMKTGDIFTLGGAAGLEKMPEFKAAKSAVKKLDQQPEKLVDVVTASALRHTYTGGFCRVHRLTSTPRKMTPYKLRLSNQQWAEKEKNARENKLAVIEFKYEVDNASITGGAGPVLVPFGGEIDEGLDVAEAADPK